MVQSDSQGSLRGRAGYAFGRLLPYVTGGLALSDQKTGYSWTYPATGELYTGSQGVSAGWTIGGGVEWAFANNWSVKAEYLHYDLGRNTFATGALTPPAPLGSSHIVTTRNQGDLVRVGLNYKFGWGGPAPVVAKY